MFLTTTKKCSIRRCLLRCFLIHFFFLMKCIRQTSTNKHEYTGIQKHVDKSLYSLCLRYFYVYIRTTQGGKKDFPLQLPEFLKVV